MNSVLQKSLNAIESSLASLLESVASDDPSAEAAAALVAADDDLSSSLEQLVTHQTNHQRLLHLRALSSALDSELSALLTNLSQARSELLSAPSTVFPSHSRQVDYDTLLSYATKISKFTRPPTHFTHNATPAAGTGTSTALVKTEPNGNTTTEGGTGATAGGGEGSANAATRPTAEDLAMLDPTANMPFAPWPSEDVMKRGILANMGYPDAVPAAGQDQTGEGGQAAASSGDAAGPVAVGGDRHMSDADKERLKEEAARKEAERKAKEQEVFHSLGLYDPDSD
ncbi:hypothetical protein ABW19_dt0204254 [Dactylella cylindrospora]|nr:hypothetical protein ABW19_dt0204254 [Dactylella cylindrospora]